MTHATKAIYRWLLSDFIKVRSVNKFLFSYAGIEIGGANPLAVK